MFGFLNLHKPAGWTSHDCVAQVRRLYQQKRVGHGGTLDPAATGVLPIAVGRATRLLQYLATPKQYRAVIRLGQQTTTDDLEGEILASIDASHLTRDTVQAQIPQFVGAITQIPPAYSAIQKDGKRLYDLARAGVEVEVPARTVEVSAIRMLNWQGGAFPELTVEIDCGPGTYIRAIARDLGTTMGVGGTLVNLVRTLSCGLHIDQSQTLAQLQAQQENDRLTLLPPETLLTHLPCLNFEPAIAQRWSQGQKIPMPSDFELEPDAYLRIQQTDGLFLGVGQVVNQVCVPKTVMVQLKSS